MDDKVIQPKQTVLHSWQDFGYLPTFLVRHVGFSLILCSDLSQQYESSNFTPFDPPSSRGTRTLGLCPKTKLFSKFCLRLGHNCWIAVGWTAFLGP